MAKRFMSFSVVIFVGEILIVGGTYFKRIILTPVALF